MLDFVITAELKTAKSGKKYWSYSAIINGVTFYFSVIDSQRQLLSYILDNLHDRD